MQTYIKRCGCSVSVRLGVKLRVVHTDHAPSTAVREMVGGIVTPRIEPVVVFGQGRGSGLARCANMGT